MSRKTPAPLQLKLEQTAQFERIADEKVRLIDTQTKEILVNLPRSEWQKIANFFLAISSPDALL